MTVRAAKIEICGFGKSSGTRDNWRELAVSCQRMTNRLWQHWLCHHVAAESADKLRAHFESYAAWQKTKVGDKPVWPCKALEPPLTVSADRMSFYRLLSREFANVNARTRGLLLNAWQAKISKRKSATGSLPGWVAILFANESLPSCTRPQPIPFDKDNATLCKKDGKYMLTVRVERLTDTGKSVVEECELMLGKRKTASVRSIVDKILAGQYAWKGSSLSYDRGKWYALIAYDRPPVASQIVATPGKTLFVRPGRNGPWRVHCDGRGWWYGGRGLHVEYARRTIQRERGQRKEHYRWAGSNQKRHGRRRAEAVWTKLSSRWRDFTKRYNNEVTTRIVRWAVANGVERIVYLQPKDRQRDSRYLSNAGNDGSAQMTWDYFQVGTMLSSKCEDYGIQYGAKAKRQTTTKGSVRAPGAKAVERVAGSSDGGKTLTMRVNRG